MSRLLKITDLGSGIMVQGTDNVLYPDNATLTYPYNSIIVVTDESDIATFRSASNNDVLFSGLFGKIEIGGETVTKQNINTKFDEIANQESGEGSFADASYDSQTKRINFYDKDGNIVSYIDATDFIKDGMVSNVEILNGNLVITFNTDSGKQPISIPLTDIFNPNEYYNKSESDAKYATQVVVNEEIAARIQGDANINTALQAKADKSDTYTKTQVDTALAAKVSKTEFDTKEEVISTALNELEENKADKSDTYTKTQVDDALALKQDASTAFSGDYDDLTNKPDLSVYAESADLATVATSGSYDDLSNKPTIPVVPTNVSAFTNDAGYLTEHQSLDNYYTKTQVDTELSAKVSKTEFDTKEEVISTALNELDENKADKTEIPDVTNFATKAEVTTALADKADKATTYTKTETDTAISTAIGQIDLSDYETKDDADVKEEVISTALNNLNTNKQDKLTAGQNITIENNVISASGGGATQVQADWNQTDTTAVDYIKNKPTIPDTSDFVTKTEYNPKELAIAEALTDLNENKADKSDIPVVPDMSNYYTKTQTDSAIQTAVGQIDLSDYVEKDDFDTKEEVISTALNNLAANKVNNLGGVANILKISASDYAALTTKDNSTLYIITSNV